MAARAAFVLGVLTLLLGGCGFLSHHASKAPVGDEAMPLTSENVSRLRQAVDRAKAVAPRPAGRNDSIRYARTVYAAAVPVPWSAAATTEAALVSAGTGNEAARQYLAVMVYDLQLQTVMAGESLGDDDWQAVYVGSGLMTEPVFRRYAALGRNRSSLP